MPANYLKLEALLNAKLDAITAASIRRLVDVHAAEDEDLDFKREPYADGQDFAVDVASMANTKGGLIVIGLDEQEAKASQATVPDVNYFSRSTTTTLPHRLSFPTAHSG